MRTLRVSNNGHHKPQGVHTMTRAQVIEATGKNGMAFYPVDTMDTLSGYKAIHAHAHTRIGNSTEAVSRASSGVHSFTITG